MVHWSSIPCAPQDMQIYSKLVGLAPSIQMVMHHSVSYCAHHYIAWKCLLNLRLILLQLMPSLPLSQLSVKTQQLSGNISCITSSSALTHAMSATLVSHTQKWLLFNCIPLSVKTNFRIPVQSSPVISSPVISGTLIYMCYVYYSIHNL